MSSTLYITALLMPEIVWKPLNKYLLTEGMSECARVGRK